MQNSATELTRYQISRCSTLPPDPFLTIFSPSDRAEIDLSERGLSNSRVLVQIQVDAYILTLRQLATLSSKIENYARHTGQYTRTGT